MPTKAITALFKKATDIIFLQPPDYKELRDVLYELHDTYAAHSGIAIGNITDEDIYLQTGKAISPIKAAFCLVELLRTSTFIRGIYKAICSLQQQQPNEKIHILYAGCGPYATLLTPLTGLFTVEQVSFHLLDVNQTSLEAVKKMYHSLGLDAYVSEYTCTDATIFRISTPTHLAISETMLNALKTEPQVAIMLNLVPQLNPEALFIPEAITVSAQLLDNSQEHKRVTQAGFTPERINLGNIYTIGRKECKEHNPFTIQIPEEINNHKSLNLLTDITVFGDEKLGIYESSLNMPVRVLNVENHIGQKVRFKYEINEKPGFRHELC